MTKTSPNVQNMGYQWTREKLTTCNDIERNEGTKLVARRFRIGAFTAICAKFLFSLNITAKIPIQAMIWFVANVNPLKIPHKNEY